MSFELRPITARDLGRRVAMERGQGGFLAVVAPEGVDVAARVATRLGQSAARLEASPDVRALEARLAEATADPTIVSGLERLSERAWQALDRVRARLIRDRLTLLVLSPHSAEQLSRNAPNLVSLFGPSYRWEDTFDAPLDPAVARADQAEFERLAQSWFEETQILSSLTRIVANPAYQRIIAMGERAIPPILRDLERQPRLWGPALYAITGAAPVRAEDAGRVARIGSAWIAWAKDNGYVW